VSFDGRLTLPTMSNGTRVAASGAEAAKKLITQSLKLPKSSFP
jgi:hypothetical protein